MIIQPGKLVAALKKVRVVREHLQHHCAAPQEPVLRIMDLKWAIEEVYSLSIKLEKVSFDAEHIGGTLERYSDNSAQIYVRSSQSAEMVRFVAVKELCHLMIDEHDDWSIVAADTIRNLLREWELIAEDGVGLKSPTCALQSELLAEVAAMELIYPQEFRERDQAKLASGETTIAKIAIEHQSPAFGIEQALNHQPYLLAAWSEAGA